MTRYSCASCGDMIDSDGYCIRCADAAALVAFRAENRHLHMKLNAVRAWLDVRLAAAPEHKGLLELKGVLNGK